MRHLKDNEKMVSALYGEWQASLFGACFIAFGIGVVLHKYVGIWVWAIIVFGIFLHSWGMAKIYSRNK